MGEVYLAQDTKLDRKVAIKFLNEEFSREVDKLKRFVQEAKAASALNHPNILTVYEIGEVDGKNYIATELIEGHTLRLHLYQSARDLLIDLKNLRRDLDIQGELERSVVPTHEAPTNAINENETRVYVGDSGAATKSGQGVSTQNITSSASNLEYALTQAKTHKLATGAIGLVLLGLISLTGYFAFAVKSSRNQINSVAVMPFVNGSSNADI